MKSLCLEGKITEKHAEQIRQILSNAKEEGEQKTGKAYMDKHIERLKEQLD